MVPGWLVFAAEESRRKEGGRILRRKTSPEEGEESGGRKYDAPLCAQAWIGHYIRHRPLATQQVAV